MINIRLAKKADLESLAVIYKDLYDNAALNENWSVEQANKLLTFFYTMQPDIFVVAEDNDIIVGAIASLVKPWFDGNRLIEGEVFVSKDYQHQGIASRLFKDHFRRAMDLYNVKIIEAHTYQEKNGYPLKWYKKQGYEVNNDLYVIEGDILQAYNYFEQQLVKE